MAAITFPTSTTRGNYVSSPWADANGGKWLWKDPKWIPYTDSVVLDGSEIADILGYTPEDSSNKSTAIETDKASNTKYPSLKALYDWAGGKFWGIPSNATSLNNVSGTNTGDETATTIKTTLGITTLSGSNTGDQTPTTLGLVIGTNVQAYNSNLTGWAGKTAFAGTLTIASGKTLNVTNDATVSGNNTGDQTLAGLGAQKAVTVSNTPPSTPSAGDLWLYTVTGKLYEFYGTSWIDLSGGVNGSGSTSLVTLGTVTTGTWNATPIALTSVAFGTVGANIAAATTQAEAATSAGLGTGNTPLFAGLQTLYPGAFLCLTSITSTQYSAGFRTLQGGNRFGVLLGNTPVADFHQEDTWLTNGCVLHISGINFATSLPASGNPTVTCSLGADSVGKLALRKGTTPQAFRVYGTFTARGSGTTNLECIDFHGAASAPFVIQSVKGSAGGTAQDMELRHGATDTNGTITDGTLAATVKPYGILMAGPLVYPTYTVATLPATAGFGMVPFAIAAVTDALVPVIGSTVATGGAVNCLVCYSGTAAAWRVTAIL